jgi:NAD(P)-dependent dehydrogenase (short-subunit alcohol dehydrogenase family)
MRLAGKFALITGGSDGIGYGIAEAFAGNGAALCLVARDPKKLDAAKARLEALGGKTETIAVDLQKPDAVDQVARAVKALNRPLDILVNNAGTATFVPYLDATRAQYDTGVNLNVTVPYFLTQALVPLMPGGGSIINISSYFAQKMLPDRPSSIYSLTKGAMNALTKAMAYELAPRGIRVNAIAPGTIDTPLRRQSIAVLPQEQQQAMAELVKRIYPAGRIGKIGDMGGIAVFLASAESEWATGAVFAVDGGLTIT